jgi:uncharacterized protein YdiU (UPF0061 family)
MQLTVDNFQATQIDYHAFFTALSEQFNEGWRQDPETILENSQLPAADWQKWRSLYHQLLLNYPPETMSAIRDRLRFHNPPTFPIRPVIESVWEAIANEDNWQPFNELVNRLQTQT